MLQLAQGQPGQKRKRTPYPLRLWQGTRPTCKGMYSTQYQPVFGVPSRIACSTIPTDSQKQINPPMLTRLRFRLPQFGVPRPASTKLHLVAP